MAILLKTASVRVSSIQIMQVRVQNKGKRDWISRYDGDVSVFYLVLPLTTLERKIKKKPEIFLDFLKVFQTHKKKARK